MGGDHQSLIWGLISVVLWLSRQNALQMTNTNTSKDDEDVWFVVIGFVVLCSLLDIAVTLLEEHKFRIHSLGLE